MKCFEVSLVKEMSLTGDMVPEIPTHMWCYMAFTDNTVCIGSHEMF